MQQFEFIIDLYQSIIRFWHTSILKYKILDDEEFETKASIIQRLANDLIGNDMRERQKKNETARNREDDTKETKSGREWKSTSS